MPEPFTVKLDHDLDVELNSVDELDAVLRCPMREIEYRRLLRVARRGVDELDTLAGDAFTRPIISGGIERIAFRGTQVDRKHRKEMRVH
jgi:hypothetical protein